MIYFYSNLFRKDPILKSKPAFLAALTLQALCPQRNANNHIQLKINNYPRAEVLLHKSIKQCPLTNFTAKKSSVAFGFNAHLLSASTVSRV